MRREVCAGCRSTNLQEVLDLGSSPLADDFPRTREEEQKRYPLGLLRCHFCTLVQLSEIVPDEELWRGDYGFYTGSSWVAAEHQRKYAQWVIDRFPRLARPLTLEIACNDGTMLQHFDAAGFRTLGIDPAAGPTAKARAAGLNVVTDQFTLASAQKLIRDHDDLAGVVIANNVVAHVADLDDFVSGIHTVLAPAGVAIFEFQYLADLVTGNQIDHVYHEHRQFFSLTSFSSVLARHNLIPISVQQVDPQGGSLRVTVAHKNMAWPDHSIGHLTRAEAWLKEPDALAGMQGRANRIKARLTDILWALQQDKKRVVGYGASAKSTTLLNFCGINEELISYFVDTTPTKHGRFTPGSKIPIIDPSADSRTPDVYTLFIWNYLSGVMRKETAFTGKWLVPIPVPVLI